jgi:hypothetical protein
MLTSIVTQRGTAPLPPFTGERVYMTAFRRTLPIHLARWQATVDAMLDGIDHDVAYLMIDQSAVKAGTSQRRPGVHIDGYWIPAIHAHAENPGRHGATPAEREREHDRGRHGGGRHCSGAGSWEGATYEHHEGLLLLSSITAARAFSGPFTGAPHTGGDCQHIDTTGLAEHTLHAGHVYAGNVTMLHESLPVQQDSLRTVVRLNVPGWSPQ